MLRIFAVLATLLCSLSSTGWTAPPDARELKVVPVAHQGRFRPMDASARLWLHDLYSKQRLKGSDADIAALPNRDAITLAWQVHLRGHEPYDDMPLFFLGSAKVKEALNLNTKTSRFTLNELLEGFDNFRAGWLEILVRHHYIEAYHAHANRSAATRLELTSLVPGLWVAMRDNKLVIQRTPNVWPWQDIPKGTVVGEGVHGRIAERNRQRPEVESLTTLLQQIDAYTVLEDIEASEKSLMDLSESLQIQGNSRADIAQIIEQTSPLKSRLQTAGVDFRMLPDRHNPSRWYSLRALQLLQYNPTLHLWQPIKNFTAFSDLTFETAQRHYIALSDGSGTDANMRGLVAALEGGYNELRASHAIPSLPSQQQLHAEVFYYKFPWGMLAAAIYFLALIACVLSTSLKLQWITTTSIALTAVAFIFHTGILALRMYVLQRPPVANMFETVLYVPWVAVAIALVARIWQRTPWALMAACFQACTLLILLELTQLHSGLEPVQPVLNSQFWLTIHVLMVVASYGVFILSGIMGHLYLLGRALGWQLPYSEIARGILNTLYIGVALLIPGTLLGGVWAAESWGRFWDWDPKESWAFISSCVYLGWIHAYTFRKIGDLGLAIGSIVGLWAISFTWYGVNYILGTGLHSYGFGSGGEHYYYLFLAGEFLFVATCTLASGRRKLV